MARSSVTEESRATGMMISMPRYIQDALRRHVEAENRAGRATSISSITRRLFTEYLGLNGANPAPPVQGGYAAVEPPPAQGTHPSFFAPVIVDPLPVAEPSLAETLARARKPSQMSREERDERLRATDPEMYAQRLKDDAARAAEADAKLKEGF